MTEGPTTGVLVPTHRRPGLLGQMLESLADATDASRLSEVLVVENGARDGARVLVRELRGRLPVRYAFLEEANKSAALNHGLGNLDSELILFFDDDVLVEPGTVEAYMSAARRYGPEHFFGGAVRPRYEGSPPPDWLADALPTCTIGFDLGPDERTSSEFLGANWAAFRADLISIGGFARHMGPGPRPTGEEVDIQQRLVDGGWTGVFLPDARVRHYVPNGHLTVSWARNRRYRQDLGRFLRQGPDPALESGDLPTLGGVPRYLWRSVLEQYARVLRHRLVRPKTRQRVQAEMRLARVKAQMRAYRLRSSGEAPVEA